MLSHRVAAVVISLIWTATSGQASPADPNAREQAREALATIEQAASEARGPQRQAWLDRVKSRRQELERNLDWLLESGDGQRALRFASAMNVFWTAFGELSRARERLDTVLALPQRHPHRLGRGHCTKQAFLPSDRMMRPTRSRATSSLSPSDDNSATRPSSLAP